MDTFVVSFFFWAKEKKKDNDRTSNSEYALYIRTAANDYDGR